MLNISTEYRCGKRRAFTLIELLVVISIIALLISILLPALRSARETAQSIVCRSQLKQVALAVEMYRGDYDGYYVPIWMRQVPGDVATDYRWGALLKTYLSDHTADRKRVDTQSVLFCPVVPDPNRNSSASYVSYGYNRWGVGGNTINTATGYPNISRELKSAPGATLMMIDIERTTDPNRRGWFEAYPSTFFYYTRHSDAANTLYADGHANALLIDEILTDTAAATNKAPWFGDNSD